MAARRLGWGLKQAVNRFWSLRTGGARVVDYSINRAFNATGQTVGETIRIRRLARARNELAERRQPIGTIATKWGFADSSHFSRSFKSLLRHVTEGVPRRPRPG